LQGVRHRSGGDSTLTHLDAGSIIEPGRREATGRRPSWGGRAGDRFVVKKGTYFDAFGEGSKARDEHGVRITKAGKVARIEAAFRHEGMARGGAGGLSMDAIDAACDALEEKGRPELAAAVRMARYLKDHPETTLWVLVMDSEDVLRDAGFPGIKAVEHLEEGPSPILLGGHHLACPFCGNFIGLGAYQDRANLLPWTIRCGACGAIGPGADSEAEAGEAWAERYKVD
jgi:hypothetical protein